MSATAGTGLAAASFAGAAVTALSNGTGQYIKGKNDLTWSNVGQSFGRVTVNTVISGVIIYAVYAIGAGLIHTNPNWFQPTKLVSSLTGSYAQKVWT